MARSSAEIVAQLSEEDRVFIAERMAQADRKLERLRKRDAGIAEKLTTLLRLHREEKPMNRRIDLGDLQFRQIVDRTMGAGSMPAFGVKADMSQSCFDVRL